MGKFLDISGFKFGKLTVIKRAPNIGKCTAWECKCECGNIIRVEGQHLKDGTIVSCGCYRRKNSKEKATKHGKRFTKLYMVWTSMGQRIHNPRNKEFKNYGGRGIKRCEEWEDFLTFEKWAFAHGYREGLTIERIDVNGDYCPQNCTWIPLEEQGKNTTRTLNNREKMIDFYKRRGSET